MHFCACRTALGARHDRTASYGVRDFRTLLAGANCNILFIMFPLDVRPGIRHDTIDRQHSAWRTQTMPTPNLILHNIREQLLTALAPVPAVEALFPPPVGLILPIGGRDPAKGYTTEEATLPGGAYLLRAERGGRRPNNRTARRYNGHGRKTTSQQARSLTARTFFVRCDADYVVQRERLPTGFVILSRVQIDFAKQ